MRVVIFCWEYPPRTIGKLADYVSAIATHLAKSKIETHIVTYNDAMTGVITEPSGVRVSRVANPVHTHVNLLTWDLTLNQEIERAAANIYYQSGKHIDLIDVYDWHLIPAAITLKNALGIPFVFSVDSLEDHRSPSANAPFNMSIRGIEWLGFFETARVICKSEWMRSEIVKLYKVPQEKITVISPTSDSWIKDILTVYKSTTGGSER